MRVLAFDATMAACSVALWCDGSVEASLCDPMVHGQAEALVPAVESVLKKAACSYDALDRIAVTVGPGSFTGVRVGLATARGLGVATECPVIGVLTTVVLAEEARLNGTDTKIAVAIDARRAELYVQCFDQDGEAGRDPLCLLPTDAAKLLEQDAWRLVGDSAEKLSGLVSNEVKISGPVYPNATVLAAMAAQQPLPSAPPGPVYIRPPDAALPKSGGRLRP